MSDSDRKPITSPVVGEIGGVEISQFAVDLVRAQANHCIAEGCNPAPVSNDNFEVKGRVW